MNDFKGDALGTVASAIGETPARTESALGFALPALITGLASNAPTTSQAAGLLDVIRRNNLDLSTFADTVSALKAPGGVTGLIDTGRPLMQSLFGGRTGSIADWMTSRSGVSRSSSSTLLSLALPLVLGAIARRVKSSGWSGSNLMALLEEQRSSLPETPGLAAALETYEKEGAPYAYSREPVHTTPVVHERETRPRRGTSWLWALPLLFLIPLIGYLFARGDRAPRTAETRPAAQATVPRAPMPEPARPVGTSGVMPAAPREFGPYRLEFQNGSSRITPASENELRELAAVLAANPEAHADVRGYTDNTGDYEANRRLSQTRATAMMNELARLGVDRSRMNAQGYGEDDPVADNATADGRRRNRRVEIHVTNER
jgi:outer membrane protein OmpA-like peptidoglycan-associated protein